MLLTTSQCQWCGKLEDDSRNGLFATSWTNQLPLPPSDFLQSYPISLQFVLCSCLPSPNHTNKQYLQLITKNVDACICPLNDYETTICSSYYYKTY